MNILYNILYGITEFCIMTVGVITMWIFFEIIVRSIK